MTRLDLVIWVAMVAACSAMIIWSWVRFAPGSHRSARHDQSADDREAASFNVAAPHITLTDQDGRPFDSDSLRGRLWAVDFIFTNCAGPCPIMTGNLRSLQETIDPSSDTHFVSVTCDPWRDDPATLRKYAESYGADLSRWTFVTGDFAEIQKCARELLLTTENPRQAAEERATGEAGGVESGDPGTSVGMEAPHTGPIVHSTRIVLIDRAGMVHDWYIGTDPDDMKRLVADVRSLSAARINSRADASILTMLPGVNASLNGLAAALLLIGRWLIHKGRRVAHQRTMIAAFFTSVIFLVCYIAYHWLRRQATGAAHSTWEVDGVIRWVYYFILITHVVLAAAVPFLAIRTLWLAAAGRFDVHRRLARVTWPIWMYVSLTGVLVYVMLYQLQPMLAA